MSATHPLVTALLPRCTFPPPGSEVECAVSGGADSTALLVLAAAAGLVVTAVHVDHGLRAGSEREAELVARVAAEVGASFAARSVVVPDGPNLEARAREARYAVLAPDALTGHTLDDQAETVLLFLLRGTGPEGLAGMDPARRPLLGLRRADTVALCDALGLGVFDDPTNDDPRFTRNRVRRELLPLMDDIAGRDVAPLLARTARLQGDLLAAVAEAATAVDPTDALAVSSLPTAVASEALRRWWRAGTGGHYAPDAAAVARMLDVAAGRSVAADVVDGWRIARTDQRLRLEPPPADGRDQQG
ncbi:MAG: tRNA lysidine(34) synthetase TilS [Acidimicrobiales bacterium]